MKPKTYKEKLWYARNIIKIAAAESKELIVAFSGGIDSTVLIDICREIDANMKAVFFDTGTEAPETREFVNKFDNVKTITPETSFTKVVKKYGIPIIHKKAAESIDRYRRARDKVYFAIYNYNPKAKDAFILIVSCYLMQMKLKLYGGYNPFTDKLQTQGIIAKRYHRLAKEGKVKISAECCTYLKKNLGKKYFKNGKVAIIGLKESDSNGRKMHFKEHRCVAYELSPPQIRPLRYWTDADIWQYVKEKGLAYNKLYDMGADSSGCLPCGFGIMKDKFRFIRLKEQHPKHYKMCMKLGYAEVLQYLNVFY
jgi:3'-phosphoadenosine 5'-phosphosulfate sulfotransferase (PAPS reductase)/FAD synthetase